MAKKYTETNNIPTYTASKAVALRQPHTRREHSALMVSPPHNARNDRLPIPHSEILVPHVPSFPESATSPPHPSIHILRLPEVMSRVGMCRASIYQHIAEGSFPKQITLGPRTVGWLEHEVAAWLAARIQTRMVKET